MSDIKHGYVLEKDQTGETVIGSKSVHKSCAFGIFKSVIADTMQKFSENPGKTTFIALGIGVGIGLLLGAGSSHRSFAGRIAKPSVNELFKIAQEFLR